MIAALMVERMPKAAANMLARLVVEYVESCILIVKMGISLGLNKHRYFAPCTAHAAGRVLCAPVVGIVAPFACEIVFAFF